MKPEFKVSYRGAADYTFKGRTYVIRHFGCPGNGPTPTSEDGHYNGNYYRVGIVPTIGTIMCDYGTCPAGTSYYHEFPPEEVCQHFPDYVPARWNHNFTAVEYLGMPPGLVEEKGYLYSKTIHEREKRRAEEALHAAEGHHRKVGVAS